MDYFVSISYVYLVILSNEAFTKSAYIPNKDRGNTIIDMDIANIRNTIHCNAVSLYLNCLKSQNIYIIIYGD